MMTMITSSTIFKHDWHGHIPLGITSVMGTNCYGSLEVFNKLVNEIISKNSKPVRFRVIKNNGQVHSLEVLQANTNHVWSPVATCNFT